jgi:type I restriction enzyme S subunit
MRKYPEYKKSGFEWLGEIPQHWKLKRLKWLVKKKLEYGANESAELDDATLPRYIRITDFDEDGHLRSNSFKSLPSVLAEDYLLEEGDILLARSGATVGKTFQFKNYTGKACFAGYLIRVKPDKSKMISDFFYLYTKSNIYENWKNSIFNKATIQNISADKYQYLGVPIPPLNEQIHITCYLDNKTSQIDSLIEKKKWLIELLKEYRTAIINHAVTKGLDPNVKMKDSGIEWIGEIPEHWEVKRLKYVLRNIVEKAEEKVEAGFKVALENIESFTGQFKQGDSTFEGDGNIFKKGDVLFSKLRPYLCKVMLAPTHGLAVGELLILRTRSILDENFMLYRMLSHGFISAVNSSSYGSKMPRSSWEYVSNLRIPIPPKQEQSQIATYLQQAMSNINRVILKQNEIIDYLQEYRTSLISDAVTGKIDVREEVDQAGAV